MQLGPKKNHRSTCLWAEDSVKYFKSFWLQHTLHFIHSMVQQFHYFMNFCPHYCDRLFLSICQSSSIGQIQCDTIKWRWDEDPATGKSIRDLVRHKYNIHSNQVIVHQFKMDLKFSLIDLWQKSTNTPSPSRISLLRRGWEACKFFK